MALKKIFKKGDAPDELPDLAIDELKKDLNRDPSEEKQETPQKTEAPAPKPDSPPADTPQPETKEETPAPNPETSADTPQPETKEETPAPKPEEKPKEGTATVGLNEEERAKLEKSFFNPFLNEFNKENFDPSKISNWYQRRFSEKGAIEEMKEYWEGQKDEFITETIEKEFKSRISERMKNLQKLEAEWQKKYIDLLQKEQEMKKEEMHIKKIIKEFSDVFKKKGNVKKESKSK